MQSFDALMFLGGFLFFVGLFRTIDDEAYHAVWFIGLVLLIVGAAGHDQARDDQKKAKTERTKIEQFAHGKGYNVTGIRKDTTDDDWTVTTVNPAGTSQVLRIVDVDGNLSIVGTVNAR